jgi:hypothetical protein
MSQKTKKEKMRRPDDEKKAMSSSKTINNKGKNSTREIERYLYLYAFAFVKDCIQ